MSDNRAEKPGWMYGVDIIRKFDNCSNETYILKGEDNNLLLGCVIENTLYRFNVNWVPENKLEWLAQVYSGILNNLYQNTKRNQLKEFNTKVDDISKFLGRKIGRME